MGNSSGQQLGDDPAEQVPTANAPAREVAQGELTERDFPGPDFPGPDFPGPDFPGPDFSEEDLADRLRSRTAAVDGEAGLTAATLLRGGAILRWQTPEAGVLLLASRGGPVTAPVAVHRLDQLSELDDRLPAETVVGYRGCDSAYHYFCVPAGEVYCLPRPAWSVTAMPVTLGFCIPLVFSGDRLVVPPPEWSTRLDLLSLQWMNG